MSIFGKFRHLYKEPERFTPSEARERRLTAMLERETRFAQVPNFQNKLGQLRQQAAALSLAKKLVNEDTSKGRLFAASRAASIAHVLGTFKESDFADPALRKKYRSLRRAQEQQRAKPAGADRRQYSPFGNDYGSTIYGTRATVGAGLRKSWLPAYNLARFVVPCIQRSVRREVIFALGKGGKGWRTPHRRNFLSGVPC